MAGPLPAMRRLSKAETDVPSPGTAAWFHTAANWERPVQGRTKCLKISGGQFRSTNDVVLGYR